MCDDEDTCDDRQAMLDRVTQDGQGASSHMHLGGSSISASLVLASFKEKNVENVVFSVFMLLADAKPHEANTPRETGENSHGKVDRGLPKGTFPLKSLL